MFITFHAYIPIVLLRSPHVLRKPGPDYDEEARKLFALLNLAPSGAASDASSKLHSFSGGICWKMGSKVFVCLENLNLESENSKVLGKWIFESNWLKIPISALENGGLFSKVLFLVAFVVFALLLILRKSPNATKKSSLTESRTSRALPTRLAMFLNASKKVVVHQTATAI